MQQPVINRIEILFKRAQKLRDEARETRNLFELDKFLSEEQIREQKVRHNRPTFLADKCEHRARQHYLRATGPQMF
jgi:hypothetical protein